MRSRNGQAAIEYLTTYGWALLILVAAIGALLYFGVLNLPNYPPQRCELDAGIFCADYSLTPSGVAFVLANGYGTNLENMSVAIFAEDVCNETVNIGALRKGDSSVVRACGSAAIPERLVGTLAVSYRFEHEMLDHTNRGSFALRRGR